MASTLAWGGPVGYCEGVGGDFGGGEGETHESNRYEKGRPYFNTDIQQLHLLGGSGGLSK